MKKIASIAAAALVLTPCMAQAAACDILKNATYGGVMSGKFDNHSDVFAAARLTFDAAGVGHGLGLIGYDPDSKAAEQSPYPAVTCVSNPDGKSGVLNFGSMGANSFTVFDGGARIWTRHEIPGRPVAGWLFRLPPAPIVPRAR